MRTFKIGTPAREHVDMHATALEALDA